MVNVSQLLNDKLKEDLASFRAGLQCISAFYKYISDDEIADYVNRVESILTDCGGIEEYFTPIASGAFKEVYSLNDDFVIKFASTQNDTSAEQNLLVAAEECGVAEVFMPTWYCPIASFKPELLQLADEDSNRWYYDEDQHTYVENCDYEGERANYIIIQPRIRHTVGEIGYKALPNNPHEYAKDPLVDANDKEIDYETARSLFVSSASWLQDVLSTYGREFFEKLAAFLGDNRVSDLHADNIGYYERLDGKVVPVIFDCLSGSC